MCNERREGRTSGDKSLGFPNDFACGYDLKCGNLGSRGKENLRQYFYKIFF